MDLTTKTLNRKTVLDVFRKAHYLTWTEVSEIALLSPSTVHRAIEVLRKKNLLIVAGKGQSTDSGGKKPLLLSLNATYRYILCFHIMIDGVTTGITDLKGRLLAENSVFFPPNSPLNIVLSHMKQSYESLSAGLGLKEQNFAGVAIGCNGVVDAGGGMLASAPNFSSWGNDIPLRNLAGKMLRTPPPIYIDNANRFDAYAEYRVGQARDVGNFMIIDGHADGFGAGVVIDGKLWRGKRHLAGEFGHITADPESDRVCYCGAKGCLEAVASMAALEEAARAGYQQNRKSGIFSRTPPGEVTYKAIYNAANTGDAFARGLVSAQASRLAVGLNAAAILLDPDVIILQGSFTKGGDFLLQALNEKIAGLGLPRIKDKVEILYSNLGRDRCLIGQAHYVADIFFQDPGLYE